MSTETQAPAPAVGRDYGPVALYIDGEWIERAGEPVLNPATGAAIGEVPHAVAADLERALAAAARGHREWEATSIDERTRILHRAADLVRERSAQIGRWMTMEQGKPLAEATGEVLRVAKLLDWDVEEARRAYGRIIPFDDGFQLSVVHRAVGPVAAFTPWNFPAGSPMRKLAASVSAGCSIVLKASEETPATACALVRCFEDAGVPAGVINLVFGVPADISAHLIASPVTRMVAFTGSVPVGKHLAGLAAAQMKPTLMELGGHAPVIVCADADPEEAARRTAFAKLANAGQVCTSPSRVFVHASLHDAYVETLAGVLGSAKVGDGLEEGVRMGPLANPRRVEAISGLVDDAARRGAAIVTGGEAPDGDGFFHAPTVLVDVAADARIMHEEPFGPVLPVVAFDDLDVALARANALPYGLAAYAFTESAATAARLGRELEAGILSINHCGGSVPEAPSGGVKESGHGKEGGAEGLEAYLVTKRISHRLA